MKGIRALFFIFLSLVVSQAFAATNLSGKYTCKGADADGENAYVTHLIISKAGDNYSFQWLNNKGDIYNVGTGVFNDNVDNAISVAFWDPTNKNSVAAMFYQIDPDGSLHGDWAYVGDKSVSTEVCTENAAK